MKNLLVRASKSPFRSFTSGAIPRDRLRAVYDHLDRPGTRNIGNLVFAHAMHKILSTSSVRIDIDDYKLTLDDSFAKKAEQINDSYDAFVIPLCNAFRTNYKESLERMTRTLKRIKIPCIVTGVGSQFSLEGDFSELDPIRTQIRDFVACILDRSASIGVRGEITKSHLIHLGFPEDRIDVIGCPSMFYNGTRMNVRKATDIERVALNMNITGIRDPRILSFTSYFNRHSDNVTYIPQVRRMMPAVAKGLAPDPSSQITIDNMMPRVLQPAHISFFCDVRPWISFMESQSFAIGTRIHGNIVALLAGTPAHVVVHDSRTLELARHFEIPYTSIQNLDRFDLRKTFERSNYDNLNKNHNVRLDTLATFLERNGLDHNLRNPALLERYDQHVRSSLEEDRFPHKAKIYRRLLRATKKVVNAIE